MIIFRGEPWKLDGCPMSTHFPEPPDAGINEYGETSKALVKD